MVYSSTVYFFRVENELFLNKEAIIASLNPALYRAQKLYSL